MPKSKVEILEEYRAFDTSRTGQIFFGEDRVLKRKVVLKFFPLETHFASQVIVKFRSESQITARLTHPNLAKIYEIGEYESEQHISMPFLVREYVEGQSLQSMIEKGKIRLSQAIDITVQICKALKHLHKQNLMHGDIWPANILITPEGTVKLLDFGSTKLVDAGEGFGDERSDIYSVGVILHELLTSKADLRERKNIEIVELKYEDESRLKIQFSPELQRVISMATADNPTQRYQDVDHLVYDLYQIKKDISSGDRGVDTTPSSDSRSISSWQLTIDSDKIDDPRLREIEAILKEVLETYGAQNIAIFLEIGSILIKFLARFRKESERIDFERDFDIALKKLNREGKKISYNGFLSLKAKYIEKALLENDKLKNEIRTYEERSIDKKNKILKNELLNEKIKIKRLEQIEKMINIITLAEKIGHTTFKKLVLQEITSLKDGDSSV